MDPLVRPKFLLLLLEQGDRSLEDHTRLFLCVANATSYPGDVLCSFYDASLNTASRALSSEDGPREDFTFVEWTLVRNGSPLPASPEEIHSWPRAQPTISPRCGASARAHRWQRAISRCDLRASAKPNDWVEDQVWEPATVPTTREPAVDGVSAEWSSGGFDWLGYWAGVRTAPSPLSVIPAGPVQPWGGFKSSSARSSKMPALPPAPASSTAVVWQPPPPLTLSPLSVRCEPRGSAILQRLRGWSIPHLRLGS